MRFLAATVVLLMPAAVCAQQLDLTELRRAARSAEAAYERTSRWLSPTTFRSAARPCVEVVGRFCLTFDSLSKPPNRPVRPEVGEARARAIATAAAYARASPGELGAAGPLVRLLVEDGRAAEAVSAAWAFAQHTDSVLWGDWLQGYARHAAGEDSAAGAHFDRALSRADPDTRAAVLSIEWLLDPAERTALEKLDSAARAQYVQRFWLVADPRLATAVNETFVQHVARHVEAWLRAAIPRAIGMESWGRDLHQLLVRYGAPVARERVIRGISDPETFIEHFDTAALALAPRAWLRDGLAPPTPGERWRLAQQAPRSAYAIPSLPRILPLEYQLTRYPRGDSMLLRLDAALPDSAAGEVHAALHALQHASQTATREVVRRGARQVQLELLVPRDSLVYGAEVHDGERLWLARYTLDPLPAAAVELSDLLLSEPSPDAGASPRARTDAELQAGERIGVYAEVHGIARGTEYEVMVGFAAAERPSALRRGVRWVGERLGLVAERSPVRVRWLDRAAAASSVELEVSAPPRPGLYYLELEVRAGERTARARRLIRVAAPG